MKKIECQWEEGERLLHAPGILLGMRTLCGISTDHHATDLGEPIALSPMAAPLSAVSCLGCLSALRAARRMLGMRVSQ